CHISLQNLDTYLSTYSSSVMFFSCSFFLLVIIPPILPVSLAVSPPQPYFSTLSIKPNSPAISYFNISCGVNSFFFFLDFLLLAILIPPLSKVLYGFVLFFILRYNSSIS